MPSAATGHLPSPRAFPHVHIAFLAGKRAQVDEFYRLALAHGGSDAGPPGLRPEYDANYYAAFVRDPDGNKIEAVCFMAE